MPNDSNNKETDFAEMFRSAMEAEGVRWEKAVTLLRMEMVENAARTALAMASLSLGLHLGPYLLRLLNWLAS